MEASGGDEDELEALAGPGLALEDGELAAERGDVGPGDDQGVDGVLQLADGDDVGGSVDQEIDLRPVGVGVGSATMNA